jgi:glutamine synthetase
MISKSEGAKRIEFRTPDPTCNPYLSFAACVMAGLDGIANKIDPGKPIDKDLYDLPPAEQKKIKQLPGDLGTVLDNLEKSNDWLLKGDVFTPDVISTWIEYKRKNELDQVRMRPHPWEFALYYDI